MLLDETKEFRIENSILKLTPQHPVSHIVSRLGAYFDRERVVLADPHIGLLHWGTEKLIEAALYKTDLVRYLDALTNMQSLARLRDSLANGLARSFHVVSLDPVCDQHTHEKIVAYLKRRVLEEAVDPGLRVAKFVGTARVPCGTPQEDVHNAMIEGHNKFFRPTSLAEAATFCGEISHDN